MRSVTREAGIIWRQIIIRARQIPGGISDYGSNPSMYASICLRSLILSVLNWIPT